MSPEIDFARKFRYGIEALLVRIASYVFRLLPVRIASGLGGYMAVRIGRYLKRSETARRNLKRAMPDLDDAAVEQYIAEMWNNLGRTFAEFPHMASLSADKIREIVTLEGLENIRQSVSSQNGVLYFTAHLANWEMGPRIFSDLGYPVSIVYRKGNNPWIGSLIQKMRSSYLVSAIPKGKTGSREIMKRLHNGERVGILVDQKMNDGIKSVFFGMEAMTAPAIARLALKFQCPVVPVRVVRQNACSFRVIVLPPLPVDRTGDTEKDTQTLIDKINKMVEEWVRERPGQWIWLHNRWPNDQ